VRTWTGLVWLRIGTTGEYLLNTVMAFADSIICGELLVWEFVSF
jgi:hypothetical protein